MLSLVILLFLLLPLLPHSLIFLLYLLFLLCLLVLILLLILSCTFFWRCLVVLALGLLVVGALFSVSHQFLVIRLVFLHFFASKMQAQKRGLAIFRPMFSSISGGGGLGSLLSWEVKKGNLVPSCRCLSSFFGCMDRKTLEI